MSSGPLFIFSRQPIGVGAAISGSEGERAVAAARAARHGHTNGSHPALRGMRNPSARVELVAPGHVPAGWEQWPGTVQDSIVQRREPGQWYLLFKGRRCLQRLR
jgi:hypothetical protein